MTQDCFPLVTVVREGFQVDVFATDFTWSDGTVSRKGETMSAFAVGDDARLLAAVWTRSGAPLSQIPDEVRDAAAQFDRDVWQDPIALEAARCRTRELEPIVRIGRPLQKARQNQAHANQLTLRGRAKDFRQKATDMLKVGYWLDSANRRCGVTVTAIGNALGWPKSTTHDLWNDANFRQLVGADVVEQLSGR